MAASPRKRSGEVLTPLELEIMQVLWDGGAGSTAEVQARLNSGHAYTTIQTMLNILLTKQKVTRVQEGRAFHYKAAVTREGAVGATLSDLVGRMFGGSGEALLMALINERQIDADDIARAARLLETKDQERNDG
jgi:predicted transcriptional regulator